MGPLEVPVRPRRPTFQDLTGLRKCPSLAAGSSDPQQARPRGFEGRRRIWQNGGVLVCLWPLSPLRTCPSERHEPYPHADVVPTQPRQETGVTTNVAVKIRLKRMGKIHAPFYRVVIMNSRTKRDGRAIEEIGKYHPTHEPSIIEINSERVQYWLGVGAQPTEQVAALLKITGDWQTFKGLPGTEGTLRVAEPKADKTALFDAAAKSAMAEPKDGATTKRKKAEPKAEKVGDAEPKTPKTPKADKAEPKAQKAEKAEKAEKADKAEPKADKAEPKAEKAEPKAEKADQAEPKAEKADKSTADDAAVKASDVAKPEV